MAFKSCQGRSPAHELWSLRDEITKMLVASWRCTQAGASQGRRPRSSEDEEGQQERSQCREQDLKVGRRELANIWQEMDGRRGGLRGRSLYGKPTLLAGPAEAVVGTIVLLPLFANA